MSKGFCIRYQVAIYLWRIRTVLKLWKVPIYYAHDYRDTSEVSGRLSKLFFFFFSTHWLNDVLAKYRFSEFCEYLGKTAL